ncbi:protein MEI2-like 4 isoform X2 [Nymphaea colorata]|uniref:protein MEI2-like 4 isoform X2 n=1 Tax=Nymphaea colorata TaxID=210225 RepID=UPI00129D58A3|nr:protein MEI2-like 4 isoform X2 [Nymphaea colorata]
MPSEGAERSCYLNRFDPKQKMEQMFSSSPFASSITSSLFSTEIHLPAERQVGFWKHETAAGQHGIDVTPLFQGNNAVVSAPLGSFGLSGVQSISAPLGSFGLSGVQSLDCLQQSEPNRIKELKVNHVLEKNAIGSERSAVLSAASWRNVEWELGPQQSICAKPATLSMAGNKADMSRPQYENGLFSSFLSEALEKKLRISPLVDASGHSIDTAISCFDGDEAFESIEEIEAQTIGNLLPDDDELFSGVVDESDYIARTNTSDEMEDFDLFSSVGGMELEADDALGCDHNNKDPDLVGANPNSLQVGSNGSFPGEHPYGEHPSRTLFVRNINSNVEDTELRALFEQYGDIRALYTACKHRGFVMISYYDIRSARNAMRALQNKPLRRRKLDIHFSIPKDNPSEKDVNQGTLVVFNLDSSVSNDYLRQIFGAYGEIKEIRETPHKHHHKFIEFYDVRAAEAALRALNRSDIAGKRIKLEPSRPGGARRLMQQLSHDLELGDANLLRQQGSPLNTSPLSCYGSHSHRSIPISSPEHGAIQDHNSATCPTVNQFVDSALQGFSSPDIVPGLSPSVRVSSIGNNGSQSSLGEPNHSVGRMFGLQVMPGFHAHSLPEHDISNSMPYNSPSTMSAMTTNMIPRHVEGLQSRHIPRIGPNEFQSHSFESVYGGSGNGACAMHGHHLMWANPNSYQPSAGSHMMWANSPSFVNAVHGCHQPHLHGFASGQAHLVNTLLPSHHPHVGSAPTSLWDRRHGFSGDPAELTGLIPGSVRRIGYSGSNGLHPLEISAPNMFSHIGKNGLDSLLSAGNVGLPSPQHRCQMFPNGNQMISVPPPPFESPNERMRGRRSDSSNQTDNKKQYELDIDRIIRGEDTRTTLMIKNIPNKYTSKMLLAAIDEHHRGTYDFIYLPIDFKNKCNVGYAFINMTDALHIVSFYEAFNGKKWEKFNSEKVASLAYARIQGKAALIAHFQNSSLMNEDKRCRPILFHTEGPNAGDQEPFPMGVNVRARSGKPRTSVSDENQGSPSTSPTREVASNATNSSAGSTSDGE